MSDTTIKKVESQSSPYGEMDDEDRCRRDRGGTARLTFHHKRTRKIMGSICKKILTKAAIEDVWSAIRDIGALHTRLVPGFVTDTRVEPGARIVTFGNGMVVREPIITVDDNARRVVWSAEGGPFTHYNASLQAFAEDGATRVVWIADFLPEEVASTQQAAMDAALQVMKTTLDRLAENQSGPV